MMDWNNEEQIIRFLLGELSEDETSDFMHSLQENPFLRDELDTYQKIWRGYQSLPVLKGNQSSADHFDEWLKRQGSENKGFLSLNSGTAAYWKYGIAASLLFLVGWLFVNNYSVKDTSRLLAQEEMLHLISAKSPTQRIKGINFSRDMREPDQDIMEVLLKLLSSDESPNVRLTIVEALQKYPLNDQIKGGLISALEREKQPVVQIAIINALVDLGDIGAKSSLENLIEKEEIQPFVKDEARLGLTRL